MASANNRACLITWGGTWEQLDGVTTYVGGQSRIMCLASDIEFHKLKERVYSCIRSDPTVAEIQMCIQATYGQCKVRGPIAPIDDNNDLMGFFEYCKMNPSDLIPLYVKVIPLGRDVQQPRSNEVEQPITRNTETNEDHYSRHQHNHIMDLGDDNDDYYNDQYRHSHHEDYNERHYDDLHDNDTGDTFGTPEHLYETSEQTKRVSDTFRWIPRVPDSPPSQVASSSCNGHLKMYDIFSSKEELKDALGKYALDNHRQWKVYRSNKSQFEVKCIHIDKCKWRARGILIPGTSMFKLVRIDSMDLHRCGRDLILPHHTQAGQRNAGIIMRDRFDVADRVYRPKDIVFEFRRDMKIDISYMQAWRARNWALQSHSGTAEESYMMLPDYCETLKSMNPGTVTHIETDSDGHFKFFFMALGASIRGFKHHIRHVLLVDGTHLKGKYPGILYTAVGHDGNSQIFPVAIGVGPRECHEAWVWFMTKLKECLNGVDELAIISDRNQSIIHAANMVFPNAAHGACCQHLKMNVRAKFRKIRNLDTAFWSAAKAYRVSDFEERFAKIRALHSGAALYLHEAGKEKWSRAFFCGRRYNILSTNHVESLNSRLLVGRRLPITMLVEYVRAVIQKWSFERCNKAKERDSHLCQKAEMTMERHVLKAVGCTIWPIDNHTFQVCDGGKGGVVDLEAGTCTCRKWQLSRFPCRHVCKVAAEYNMDNAYQWVSPYYNNDTVKKAWGEPVFPLPHQSEWKVCEPPMKVLPPQAIRPTVGRPRSQNRILSQGEEPARQRCSRCGQVGHNRATCRSLLPSSQSSTQASRSQSQIPPTV